MTQESRKKKHNKKAYLALTLYGFFYSTDMVKNNVVY